MLRDVTRTGVGHVIAEGAARRAEAAAIYTSRFPDLPAEGDPLVVITLDPAR